jgi:hypothetical protein
MVLLLLVALSMLEEEARFEIPSGAAELSAELHLLVSDD